MPTTVLITLQELSHLMPVSPSEVGDLLNLFFKNKETEALRS